VPAVAKGKKSVRFPDLHPKPKQRKPLAEIIQVERFIYKVSPPGKDPEEDTVSCACSIF
jgi:hypothetical protein